MGFNYTLINETPSKVTFGLWSGPGKHEEVHTVDGNDQENHSARYSDARAIGVWLDEGNFYPSNNEPILKGFYFVDGRDYTITLTSGGLSVNETTGD